MPSLSPRNLPSAELTPEQLEQGHSLWANAWHRLGRNKLAFTGLVIVAVISLLCLVGPIFSQSYRNQTLELRLASPGARYWFGTDTLGRDLFSRILYGGRISLGVALCATFVSLTIGVVYGAVAGYVGGKLDRAMMRVVDILYVLPFTIFVILLTMVTRSLAEKYNLGATFKVFVLFAAIGAVEWLTMARIVRGQVLSIKKMEFIEAALSLGLSKPRIIFRHIVPNILGPIIVYVTLTIPSVMLLEAFLSFLGLGVQAPMSSWGVLIKEGVEKMEDYWWLLAFPAGIFSLTLFSLNFLGDGLRDALDVRSSKD
jgi:oligopeptide transport system permease protein